MPDLSFRVEGVEPLNFAASPALDLKLHIENANPVEEIQTIALRCQIQMEVTRRQYTAGEQEQLVDLFGEPSRWSETLRNRLWTNVNLMVSRFHGSTVADLEVPCTFDFNIAATKYFHGLSDGDVPLNLMFSGTVFYADESGALKATLIPWNKEARFRLPIRIWKDMMDRYYPNTAWLHLRRDVFDRLNQYKMNHGIPEWEQVLERLLGVADAKAKEFAAS